MLSALVTHRARDPPFGASVPSCSVIEGTAPKSCSAGQLQVLHSCPLCTLGDHDHLGKLITYTAQAAATGERVLGVWIVEYARVPCASTAADGTNMQV
jgi:hypothetical protein